MSVGAYRRYCLAKRHAAAGRGDHALAAAWRAKQEAARPAVSLPPDFPSRAALVAAGYVALQDLVGATADELRARAGLRARDAREALTEVAETMGYVMSNGRWAATDNVILVRHTTRSTGFETGPMELGDRATARLTLDVAQVVGAGTLSVAIETRENAASPWRPVGVFPPRSEIGAERRSFAGPDRFLRAVVTTEGGATFTFAVFGEVV